MLRLVFLLLVCVLGFMLSGLPRVLAADDCARACLEHEEPGGDEDCQACLCARPVWGAPPLVLAPPEVLPRPMDFALEREGVPRDGSPREVFRPPRSA
ncbi:hypothetical protein [Melittangium boletus]|uniref:Uncharacterized protein n=1 Tax=Melittangium boletus DSM 14713 TaxID=1294270 RepID=A0A250IS21_9BACT|nr:hypothetical protein [Melittangium boletus]ATB33736.1 hypothetical protein MEBOL_007234 [Melittangium boletus DSM 14713]